MALRVKSSYLAALTVLVGIGAWMGTGEIRIGGQASADDAAGTDSPVPSTQPENAAPELFAVRVVNLKAEPQQRSLEVRGRTEADAIISVRSQTSGILEERFVSLGERVEAGQLLCRLEMGARQARVLQEKAALAQAEADFNANQTLTQRGFVASNRTAASRASLDAARARLQEAELELSRIEIKAPASGIILNPLANAGELLTPGNICATILDADPIFMTGQVSERDIGALAIDMKARVELITGEHHEGEISYIAPSADPATRTFRIDIEIDNKNDTVRDGVTATAQIALPAVRAHKLAPSMLTLNDTGTLGVRTVDMDTHKAVFQEITIIGETPEGVWVSGLPEEVSVIAVGQDYVTDGQTVRPQVMETRL